MGISRFKYLLLLAAVILPVSLCSAEDTKTAEPISAEDEAKIDAVIEAAQKPIEAPAPDASAESKSAGKIDGKAEATISGSGEKISVAAEKKEPGKAVVTLGKTAEKKPVKTAKAAKRPPQPRLPQLASAPKPAPVVKKPAAAVRKASAKPVVVAKRAPKQAVSMKPVRVEVQKPLGSVTPLSAFELGRYQYCGSDRDCMVAVNGCCDCANGGEDVAVNRERFEAFRNRFACLHVACGEQSVEPTCSSGVVSCVNHKCRYFSDAALEEKF